jgi:hypothetical protein
MVEASLISAEAERTSADTDLTHTRALSAKKHPTERCIDQDSVTGYKKTIVSQLLVGKMNLF